MNALVKAEENAISQLDQHYYDIKEFFNMYKSDNDPNNTQSIIHVKGKELDLLKESSTKLLSFENVNNYQGFLNILQNFRIPNDFNPAPNELVNILQRKPTRNVTISTFNRTNEIKGTVQIIKEKYKVDFSSNNNGFREVIDKIAIGCDFYPKYKFFDESISSTRELERSIEALKAATSLLEDNLLQIEEELNLTYNAEKNIEFSSDFQQMSIRSNKSMTKSDLELISTKAKKDLHGINTMIIFLDKYLATGSTNGTIGIYTLDGFDEIMSLKLEETEVNSLLQMISDSPQCSKKYLVAGYSHGSVKVFEAIFDVSNGIKNLKAIEERNCFDGICCSKISSLCEVFPDYFVSVSFDCNIVVYSLNSQKYLNKFLMQSSIKSVTATNSYFATGDDDCKIIVWDTRKFIQGCQDMKLVKSLIFPVNSVVRAVKFVNNYPNYLFYATFGSVILLDITFPEGTGKKCTAEELMVFGHDNQYIYKFLIIHEIPESTRGRTDDEVIVDENSERQEIEDDKGEENFQIIAFSENHQISSIHSGVDTGEDDFIKAHCTENENMRPLLTGSDPFGSAIMLKKSNEKSVFFMTSSERDRKINLWRLRRTLVE